MPRKKKPNDAAKKVLKDTFVIAQNLKEGIEPPMLIAGKDREVLLKVANNYPDFVSFEMEFGKLTVPTVHAVIGKARQMASAPKDGINDALLTVRAFVMYEEPDSQTEAMLETIRNYLEQHVQRNTSVFDMAYVKYWDCCHCGEVAPPGGHPLTFHKLKGWKYPICQECIKNRTPVDPYRIAELYYIYALQIERAYNEL